MYKMKVDNEPFQPIIKDPDLAASVFLTVEESLSQKC